NGDLLLINYEIASIGATRLKDEKANGDDIDKVRSIVQDSHARQINIDDIVILDDLNRNPDRDHTLKINSQIKYYKNHGHFYGYVTYFVEPETNRYLLTSGYIKYLVAKKLGLPTVPAI